MKSRILYDPDIRNLLLVLFVCVVVLCFALLDYSTSPCPPGVEGVLLCNYYNGSEFHAGCAVMCNMSDVVVQSYLSGATTSKTV